MCVSVCVCVWSRVYFNFYPYSSDTKYKISIEFFGLDWLVRLEQEYFSSIKINAQLL